MSDKHVVVDGSNIATEGRALPSLQQLDEAVRAFVEQYVPGAVTVVVDASFPNRIDASERATYEEAVVAGEIITPPAGVIGRGDAFLLEIADRADAVVLSNDSFQEFHGQYGWLFEQGRLIGGKPVPHVGWIFMERAPVRGPLSRKAVSEAKKARRKAAETKAGTGKGAESKAAAGRTRRKAAGKEAGKAAGKDAGRGAGTRAAKDGAAAKVAEAREAEGVAPTTRSRRRRKASEEPAKVAPSKNGVAPAKSAELAVEGGGRRRRRRSSGESAVEPYNEALPFIEFVSAHPVGSQVEGEVERFSSHGAYVLVEGTRCYLPLKHMADPPPRSARELMELGERYTFEVHAIDTPRRGVDLALPGVVPTREPEPAPEPEPEGEVVTAGEPGDQPMEEERVAAAKKSAAKRSAAKKARKTAKKRPAARKSTAKRAGAKRPAARKSAAKRATKKRAAKKSTARKSTAKRAGKRSAAKRATKKRAAKKSPAKRAAKKRAAKKR